MASKDIKWANRTLNVIPKAQAPLAYAQTFGNVCAILSLTVTSPPVPPMWPKRRKETASTGNVHFELIVVIESELFCYPRTLVGAAIEYGMHGSCDSRTKLGTNVQNSRGFLLLEVQA